MSDQQDAIAVRNQSILQDLTPVFDIPLSISIEVARMRLRVRDLMKLTPGYVIELRRPAGEPFDVCVNGLPVARGEVITNPEQTSGVRIIEVQKPGGMNS